MNLTRPWKRVLPTVAAICLLLGQAAHIAHARRESLPYNTPQEQTAYRGRTRKFARLWLGRNQRNVTPDLLQMLKAEPSSQLRAAIVVALGRIENPQALQPLQSLLVNAQAQQRVSSPNNIILRDDIPVFRIRLALGRIKSRGLKGTAKLNTVAREVGKSWPSLKQDAQRMRVKLQSRMGIYEVQKSEDRAIVEEFYDVLYRMGKRGENIRALGAFELILWKNDTTNVGNGIRSAEQAKLFASSLSNRKEIDFWFKRSLPPSTAWLSAGHVLSLGPQVPDVLMTHLKLALRQIKAKPSLVEGTGAYRGLFNVAVATGERRFLPILRDFQKIDDPQHGMRIRATVAIEQLEKGGGSSTVIFP